MSAHILIKGDGLTNIKSEVSINQKGNVVFIGDDAPCTVRLQIDCADPVLFERRLASSAKPRAARLKGLANLSR